MRTRSGRKPRKIMEQEMKRRTKLILTVSMIVTIAVLGTIAILLLNINEQSVYYSGKYALSLKSLIMKYRGDDRWRNETIYYGVLRKIFYEYYLKLYNLSTGVNNTFLISRDHQLVINVFLATNETLYIETYGNDTYYYVISLDKDMSFLKKNGSNLLVDVTLGNSEHEIRIEAKYIYNETYIILFTNATTPVKGWIYFKRTPPLNLSSILAMHPFEYTSWLFQNWVKERYLIKPVDLEHLENTRPPWIIIQDNVTEITSLEAVLLLDRLYNLTGFETRYCAVDLNGDGEADHVALMVRYNKRGDFYGNVLVNYVLRDANIYFENMKVKFKHVVLGNATWIVLDPLYEAKYIPSFIQGTDVYEIIGLIL